MTTTSDGVEPLRSPGERRGYVHSLDGVRGLAALVVVLYHVEYFHAWFARGYLAVDLFFVLSGYVLTHRYGAQALEGRGFLRFVWARLARLYPLHVATLLLLAGAEYVLSQYGKHAVIQGELGYTFALNAFLLQAVGLTDSPSWNTSAWSISAEFWLNLAWFGLLGRLVSRRAVVPVLMFSWCISLLVLMSHSPLVDYHMEKLGYLTSALWRCLAGFSCGALIYYWRDRLLPYSRAALFLALICVVLVIYRRPAYADYWVVGVVFPLLMIASLAAAEQSWFVRFLEWRPVAWLGLISYSVYLNHLLVIKAVNLVAARMDLWQRGLVIVSLVLGLSTLTYRLIESPARRWLMAFGQRPIANPGIA